ncbi:MAG: hypothetical protein ABIY55_23075 [Kofleriaceae bacterium]
MRRCAVLVLATACTHHQQVRTLLPDAPSTRAIAELGDHRQVEVLATATPEGLRWVSQDTGSPGRGAIIDPADMRGYATFRHGRGLAEGIAVGGLTGVAVGAVLGFASGDDACAPESFCILRFSAGEKAGIGAFVLGSVGVAVGALVGAVAGSRDVHELDTEYVPRVTASLTPGHAGGALSWRF